MRCLGVLIRPVSRRPPAPSAAGGGAGGCKGWGAGHPTAQLGDLRGEHRLQVEVEHAPEDLDQRITSIRFDPGKQHDPCLVGLAMAGAVGQNRRLAVQAVQDPGVVEAADPKDLCRPLVALDRCINLALSRKQLGPGHVPVRIGHGLDAGFLLCLQHRSDVSGRVTADQQPTGEQGGERSS